MTIGITIVMNANNLRRLRSAALAAVLTVGVATVSFAQADSASPESLLASCGIDTSRVHVATSDGITIIRGNVPDRQSIEQTNDILEAAGYRRIANLLTVATRPDDETLRRTVERELLRTRSLDGCRFRVSMQGGVVLLQGTVRRDLQKELAVVLARSVDGVRQVVSTLRRTSACNTSLSSHQKSHARRVAFFVALPCPSAGSTNGEADLVSLQILRRAQRLRVENRQEHLVLSNVDRRLDAETGVCNEVG
jgi:osmotically-inducible protein OsmY